MKKIIITSALLYLSFSLLAQMVPGDTEWYAPIPPKVSPANKPGAAPSDAIILFNGEDLSMWKGEKGDAQWEIRNGELTVKPGTGSIMTRQHFGDVQLHIEFKSPAPGQHSGQNRGNSGIFLQSTYEVQVLDGDNNDTYVNGMVGSIYKQQAPLANAYTHNGEWQVYDIYWRGPRFDIESKLESPAIITVVLNDILVQNNFVLKGHTPYIGYPAYTPHGLLPLMLQDHGTEVAYRNIWIREL
ncbi:MAG: DUF1080 domain-containing protein [Proteiniphilum sp.]|nr:DUF1080 domain-containing protein [Proteiniphilum sp.]